MAGEISSSTASSPPIYQGQEPYVGPRPFEKNHSHLFFGRTRETSDLRSLIIAHRIVLFYAQSGAGKTSLLNAGLIPALAERFEVLPVARVQGTLRTKIAMDQITNLYVFNTLMSWSDTQSRPRQLTRLSLSTFLKDRAKSSTVKGQATPRVAIFDQFEELFTFYPERWRERQGLFEQIRDALEEDPLLRVLLVMREDYIAQLDPHAPILPEALRTRFRLEPLREDAALVAITKPLEGTQRSFAPGVAQKLVDDLLKTRVETATGETADVKGEFVEAVQLQVVCQSLWRHLPLGVMIIRGEHLRAHGDVNEALSAFYNQSIKQAVETSSINEKELRDWFEQKLITPAGTRGIVYRGKLDTGGILNAAVDELVKMHIIRGEWRAGARWYELTHDRFIIPIQESNKSWQLADIVTSEPDTQVTRQILKVLDPAAERRNRSRMLQKVRLIWVRGVLEQSLHSTAMIEFNTEFRPDAVSRPWDMTVQQPTQAARPITPGTRAIDIFDDANGELLILGAPGSGKTTLLLELTRDLLDRAEAIESYPIPVVFNLSQWAKKRLPLDNWLADMLNEQYDLPRKIGQAWVQTNQILPLLDGLDEVTTEYRAECVEAISKFRRERGLVPIAICSRFTEYEALSAKLRLNNAIIIKPLTLQQIDTYLANAGQELVGLRTAIQMDPELRALVESPLLLNVMMLTYRGMSPSELTGLTRSDRYNHLFATYVQIAFTRRSRETQYSQQQSIHWLTWLARAMTQHAETIFYIEGLQPDWLTSSTSRQRFVVITQFVIGLIVAIIASLASVPLFSIERSLTLGLISGIITGIVVGWWSRQSQPIILVETLQWSSQRALRLGLVFGGLAGLVTGLVAGWALGLAAGLVVGLLSGLVSSITGGIVLGLSPGELEMKMSPNQGVQRSARNALLVGVASGLIFGLAGISVLQLTTLIVSININNLPTFSWTTKLSVVAFLAALSSMPGALVFGGYASLAHLTLRFILWRGGEIPWNYARFLDYASERVLLRRVGGGYIFIHRLLMGYFASLTPDETTTTE